MAALMAVQMVEKTVVHLAVHLVGSRADWKAVSLVALLERPKAESSVAYSVQPLVER